MIMVKIKRVYKDVEYEIELDFDTLDMVKDVGPIIKSVEEFIDKMLEVKE